MKSVSRKIPAKINLTLDVLGVKNGYHEISSLCTSINLYDKITVKKRQDKQITLKERGILSNCAPMNNNAVKSARLFSGTFATCGVDVILDKRIPVGAGLGGSSADIAGVIKAMQKLFGIGNNVKHLADQLGSDSGYMMDGGLAVISGRGEKVFRFRFKPKFYLIILCCNQGVSAKDAYAYFDQLDLDLTQSTDLAVDYLQNKRLDLFFNVIKNDLYFATKKFVPSIEYNLKALELVGADKALMTGSGSAVYGIFKNRRKRNSAFKILKKQYKCLIIKAKTI